jgi:hypothetical protein
MASKKPETLKFAETTSAYLERLECGHTRFVEAVGSARERATRVTDKLVENLLAGQRDALALGKTLAAQPTEYGKNVEAFLHSLTSAQERALELAKTVYRTNNEIAADARAAAAKALESSKTFAKPFEGLTSLWTPAAK